MNRAGVNIFLIGCFAPRRSVRKRVLKFSETLALEHRLGLDRAVRAAGEARLTPASPPLLGPSVDTIPEGAGRTQSAHFVRQALTAYTWSPPGPNGADGYFYGCPGLSSPHCPVCEDFWLIVAPPRSNDETSKQASFRALSAGMTPLCLARRRRSASGASGPGGLTAARARARHGKNRRRALRRTGPLGRCGALGSAHQ